MKDKKKIILSIFCVISILLLAFGITYSIFTYTKIGDTENTITTGKITFIYTENTGNGTGINITDAFPVSDELGMAYSSDSQVFDFKVESEIVGNMEIPYEVTVGKTASSTLPEEYIKIYLTDTTEIEETTLLEPTLYSNLPISSTSEDEKQIYFDTVEANKNYEKDFRLRMWIDENSDQEEINDKLFTVKVGVYSPAEKQIFAQKFSQLILDDNNLITSEPTLSKLALETNENGLYKSTLTNSGEATYYFRGNIDNNYVSFAGQTWRVVRINEDGTIRLILKDTINDKYMYAFNSDSKVNKNMYYTESEIKLVLDNWYQTNLVSYNDKIATGDYFCEQAKVKDNMYTPGNVEMEDYDLYVPDYRCTNDGNGYGIVNSNIGLITYDELAFAGTYPFVENGSYYITNGVSQWTMSPAGFIYGDTYAWLVDVGGRLTYFATDSNYALRPVINLKANVLATGNGTSTDPYVVQ